VNERKKGRDHGENGGGGQENAPGAENGAKIDREEHNEHQRDIKSGANPSAIIEAYAEVAF
jgi:hypothetical protein